MNSTEDGKQSAALSALIVSQSLIIRELMRIDPNAGVRLKREFQIYSDFYVSKNSKDYPGESDTVKLVMDTLCVGLPDMPENDIFGGGE